jgi:hypothetical protein
MTYSSTYIGDLADPSFSWDGGDWNGNIPLWSFLTSLFRSRATLQLAIIALRHQLTLYQRKTRRPRIQPADRLFWSWFSRCWTGWQNALVFVQPGTVIAWLRRRFRGHWAELSRQGRSGRPRVSEEVKALIRKISAANPSWIGLTGERSRLSKSDSLWEMRTQQFDENNNKHCPGPPGSAINATIDSAKQNPAHSWVEFVLRSNLTGYYFFLGIWITIEPLAMGWSKPLS